MILYVIQAHTDADQLIALIERIFDEENYYIANLDPVFADQGPSITRMLSENNLSRVIVRTGAPLNWGGISQVHAALDVMQYALSLSVPWRFLINLSADSMPLVPQSVIRDFYSEGLRHRQRIYLSFFGKALGSKPSGLALLPWGGERGFDGSGETVAFYRRIPAFVEEGAKSLFTDRATNPVFRTPLRGSLHVSDLTIQKKLIIRRLLPYEADYRMRAFGDKLLYGGRCWHTLERSAVEGILSDPLTAEILHYLEHFLCPDELFLQTYVMNTRRFMDDEVMRNNQRFERGDAMVIRDGMADRLFSSGAFFARRVKLRECPIIAARLDRVLGRSNDRSL